MFAAGQNEVRVSYKVTNIGDRDINCRFGSEWNLALIPTAWREGRAQTMAGQTPVSGSGEFFNVQSIAFEDPVPGLRLTVEAGSPAGLWCFPVETVSSSEEGFERIFQCGCVLLLWPLSLKPGQQWTVGFSWRASPLNTP